MNKTSGLAVAVVAALALAGCSGGGSSAPASSATAAPATEATVTAPAPAVSAPAVAPATSAPAPAGTSGAPHPAAAKTTATAYTYDAAKGKALYEETCAACHQSSGTGVPGAFPPLKGNPVVTQADPTVQIHTALFGKKGPLTVLGKQYKGFMPGFGQNLSDTDAANLLNYERSSWGNAGKHMTPDQVAAVRAKGE